MPKDTKTTMLISSDFHVRILDRVRREVEPDEWRGLEAQIKGLVMSDWSNTVFDPTTMPAIYLEQLIEFFSGDERFVKQVEAARAALAHQKADTTKYEAIMATKVSSVEEFYRAMKETRRMDYNIEFQLGERWYPMATEVKYMVTMMGKTYCLFKGSLQMVGHFSEKVWFVGEDTFRDDEQKLTLTVEEVLKSERLRPVRTDLQKYRARCDRAAKMLKMNGQMREATGPGIGFSKFLWMERMQAIDLGTKESAARIVLESELEEQRQDMDERVERTMDLAFPFVRVFDLAEKRYLYIDEEDLRPVQWAENAMDNLILPPNYETLLKKVFVTNTSQLFGDLVHGKHGGMIILARGKPGVGKTQTAEVFAEYTHRPLYAAEIGEMGLTLETIENNLQRIFQRVARWNAVLLLDEADIFLAARDNNMERSAIVGVFLRLLDYYKGVLFLTTNRSDTIDEAFRSRITISLHYPDLSQEVRHKIWSIMLNRAGVHYTGDLKVVAEREMNGRQIRNMVRLLKVMHPEGEVTTENILSVCEFSTTN